VFGIMNLVNLAHGSLYMVGAYLAARPRSGPALPARRGAGLAGTLVVGMAVEVTACARSTSATTSTRCSPLRPDPVLQRAIAIVWDARRSTPRAPCCRTHQALRRLDLPGVPAAVIVVGLLVAASSVRRDAHALGMLIAPRVQSTMVARSA